MPRRLTRTGTYPRDSTRSAPHRPASGKHQQASLVCFLRMCDIEPMSEDLARQVGVLAGKSGHDDSVAAVEDAIRREDAIVTSNVTHIRKVAEAAGAELRIESV